MLDNALGLIILLLCNVVERKIYQMRILTVIAAIEVGNGSTRALLSDLIVLVLDILLMSDKMIVR